MIGSRQEGGEKREANCREKQDGAHVLDEPRPPGRRHGAYARALSTHYAHYVPLLVTCSGEVNALSGPRLTD